MAPRKNVQLSEHFLLSEFHCKDGTPVPPAAIEGLKELCHWWLEPLRDEFGPVAVYSGYRTDTWNAKVGGEDNSYHLYHRDRTIMNYSGTRVLRPVAADVRPRRGDIESIGSWCRRRRSSSPNLAEKHRGGIGVYVHLGFVHLDTGPARDWRG